MSQLRSLDLVNNLQEPTSAGARAPVHLDYLGLSNNILAGAGIDAGVGPVVNLRMLSLEDSPARGYPRPELGQLPKLEYVYLKGNRTGCVPLNYRSST